MKTKRSLLAIAIAAAFAGSLFADVPDEAPLETIVVIGRANSFDDNGLSGSLDILNQDEMAYEHVDDTLELFSKVPGVYLSRFNQGIINTDVSIRGFAGDGSTPHAKLLIDGIPSNLHNGYNELDQLFPLAIGSIEVFKGTSDPRYGLFNIAGNYLVNIRRDIGSELEATMGSFATRELQGYHGSEHGDFRQAYFAGFRQSNGYRDHTDLEKYALSGDWAIGYSEQSSVRLTARFAGYNGDAPGYLSAEQARNDPRSSADYANQDGGEKETSHISLHHDSTFGDNVKLQLKAYDQTFERERWVRFSQGSSLQNRFDHQQHRGLIGRFDWPLNAQWNIDGGLDWEQQDNLEQRFGTIGQTRQRNPNVVSRNFQYDFETTGGYLRLSQQLQEKFRWNLALRADRIDGDFQQTNASGVVSTRDIYAFGTILQPKLNIALMPTDSIVLFANAGRSFQHPFGSSAFTAGDRHAREVSINDGWELGARWQANEYVDVRASTWRQQASDEFVVVDGTPQNVGETDRQGADVVLQVSDKDFWVFWGSYTIIDSEIVRASDSDQAFVGNELRSIPDYTAAFGLNVFVSDRLTTRLHWNSQGDYYVNEANLGGKFGGYSLLGFSADYRFDWGGLKLQLNNLTDEYFEYVFDQSSDGSDTLHSPGDGRHASLTVTMVF